MPDERSIRMSSILGESALVIGNVEGQSDLEVRGRIQGDVILEGRFSIAPSGSVLGTVEAINVTVSGELRGDVIARDNVLVTAGARIEGNIAAPRVAIEPGAKVRGQLNTTDAPGGRGTATTTNEDAPVDIPEARSDTRDDMGQPHEVHDDEAPDDETQGARKPRRRRRRKRNGPTQPSGAALSDADEPLLESVEPPGPPRPEEDEARDDRQRLVPVEKTPRPKPGRSDQAVPNVEAELRVGPRKAQGGKPPRLPTFVKGAKGRMRGA